MSRPLFFPKNNADNFVESFNPKIAERLGLKLDDM
jgi:hypothetical protein